MGPTLSLQRYLDNFESNIKGAAPAQAVEYQGHVDEEVLARAFEILCTHHPVLRGRIRADDQGNLLYIPPDNYPELVVFDGDENTLRREARRPWYPSNAVARLILIRGETRGFVAFRMDHAVADGTSFRAMFNELWRLYTDLANGSNISAGSDGTLPCPPSDLFRRSPGIQFDRMHMPKPLAQCESIERRIHLSEAATTRLIAAARAKKTSVHALACGAILVAIRARGTAVGPTPMVCWSLVNLRNLVTPPVGAMETTNFAARHMAVVNVSKNTNPVEVGREVKVQLTRAITCGELSINPVQSPPPHVDTVLEQRLATVSVSNNGVLPRFAQPAGLSIINRLSIAYPMTVMFPTYSLYTFGGQLSMRVVYPADLFTIDEVEKIVKQTTEHLCQMGI